MGKVRAFDDLSSWLHFAYATIVAFLSPEALIATSIIFYAYQKYEREKWEYKRGDFVEWLVGVFVGVLLRFMYGLCS